MTLDAGSTTTSESTGAGAATLSVTSPTFSTTSIGGGDLTSQVLGCHEDDVLTL
jgi:hypothetical protein